VITFEIMNPNPVFLLLLVFLTSSCASGSFNGLTEVVTVHKNRRGFHFNMPGHAQQICNSTVPNRIKLPLLKPKTVIPCDAPMRKISAIALVSDTLPLHPDTNAYSTYLSTLPDSLREDYQNWLKSRRLLNVAILSTVSALTLMIAATTFDDGQLYLETIGGLQLFAGGFGILAYKAYRKIKHPKKFKTQVMDQVRGIKNENAQVMRILLYVALGTVAIIVLSLLLIALLSAFL
jgi:hypothetical protein